MTPKQPTRPAARHGRRSNRGRQLVVAAVVAVVAVAAVIVAISGRSSTSDKPTATATADVIRQVTSVPAATLAAVGVGTAKAPQTVQGTPRTLRGKPEVLYIGAEYCPYCAAQRWALVVALSRFGTFNGLALTHSSSIDVFPDTPTFTFHGATYTSPYLAFTAVETQTNQPDGNGGYRPLGTPTADQQAAIQQLDPNGGIPFIDFAGRYVISGATYDPGLLQHHTAPEIAAALSDPTSAIAKAIDGGANTITTALCQLTNNQPGTVCH